MMSNVISSSHWQLYVILDRASAGERPLEELAAAAIRGGADVLQLRDKAADPAAVAQTAERVLAVTRPAGIPLIINDYPEIASRVGAQGAHLGQEDGPLADGRARAGPGCLLGRSTHSLAQALAAVEDGADYLACGPVYATPTKPAYGSVGLELIRQVMRRIARPVVCIGGIDRGNAAEVVRAGARCLAVVRAVCAAPDPEAAARELKQIIRTTSARDL